MPGGNKNLLGWIGLGMIIISGIRISFLLSMFPTGDEELAYFFYLFSTLPFLIFGLFLFFFFPVKIRDSLLRTFLLLLILFSLFGLWLGFTRPTSRINDSLNNKAEKLTKEALTTEDFHKCFKIKIVPFSPQWVSDFFFPGKQYTTFIAQGKCITETAIVKKDASLCKKIRHTRDSPGLIDICFEDLATSLKDESLCERVDAVGRRDGCYLRLAGVKQDSNICEKINDEYTRNGCLSKIEK